MGVQLTQTQYKMPSDEICFEAPEINMASDIVLDARVSVVTVAKLVDVSVKEAANALEQSWTIFGPYGTFGPNFSELWNNALDLTLPCLSNFLLQSLLR